MMLADRRRMVQALLWVMGLTAAACGNGSEPRRLVLEGCAHWEQGHLWCAARVFDADQKPVTGLGQNAFALTESVPGQDARTVTFDSKERAFEDPGFYERSVTADKVDIIFAIDISRTMEDFVAPLKPELGKILDALYQRRADFRVGFILYDNLFDEVVVEPFRGPMDQAALRKYIADLSVRGEWWTPAATFDALLLAGDGASQGLGWREDARHVVVAVSDSFSASAYGLEWYSIWCTNANQSAAHEIQKAKAFRLLYTTSPWAGVEGTDPSNDSYASGETNPKALSLGKMDPLGEKLPWPLTAADLVAALDLSATEVADSVYYFAWMSGLSLAQADGQKVKIDLSVTLPDGTFTQKASVPAVLSQRDISLQVEDVRGRPVSDATAVLLRRMGDLTAEVSWDNAVESGRATVPHLEEGDFILRVYTDGWYQYEALRYFSEQPIQVIPGGQTVFDVKPPLADQAQELARARGLLADIADFAPANRPFADYALEVRAWLDGLDQQGMDRTELERLKRFNVGLSAYLNTLSFGEAMVEGAIQDFVDAARELRELFRRTEETADELDSDVISWDTLILLASYLIQRDLDAIAKWGENEGYVELLKETVVKELVPKAVEWMLDLIRQNCENGQLAADIIDLVKELVYANWDNDSGALQKVVLKIAAIFLDLVLDPAVEAVESALKDELRDALGDAAAEYSDEVASLVRVGLEAIWGGISALLDDSQDTSFLNAVKTRVQAAVAKLGDPKNVKKAVSAVIDILKQKSGPGMMREFVLPLLDMILRTAVDVDGGKVDHDIIIETLARLFCNYVLIERYFSTPLENGMRELWAQAQGFAPDGNALERYDAMHQDFRAYRRDVVEPNVDLALAAMSVQETFEQIDQWLSGAEYLLYIAEYLTAATCVKFPDFCETAFEDVPNLVKFIRGLRLMTNIVEFALKLDGANKIAHATANGNPVLWATP